MGYISVRNWRKFQHYDPEKRVPPWIKNHTELMDTDEYLDLSGNQRAVLHGLWLEYAKSRCQLSENTASISRRLGLRVTKRTLDALVHAGFIEIVASKELADGYHDASPEVEVEVEKEKETPKPPFSKKSKAAEVVPLMAPEIRHELDRLAGRC